MPEAPRRIAYLDGLRGMAIGTVLVFHAWAIVTSYGFRRGHAVSPGSMALIQLGEGLTLFFVLSGICLSLPWLKKRAAGRREWFSVREFALRRAWRILPPYYAALAASIMPLLLPAILHHHHDFTGRGLGAQSVLSHLLLIQNVTPSFGTINAPMWSLGLEWQWYFLFPIVFAACLRFPRATLGALFALLLGWHLAFPSLSAIHPPVNGAPVLYQLPSWLVVFALGIVVADAMFRGISVPPRLLGLLVVVPLLLVFPLRVAEMALAVDFPLGGALQNRLAELGLVPVLYGISFAALAMLAHQVDAVRRVLSWDPLVKLGLVSYSVYLVHMPVIAWTTYLVRRIHGNTAEAVLANVLAGLLVGVAFYAVVERRFVGRPPFLSRAATQPEAVAAAEPSRERVLDPVLE